MGEVAKVSRRSLRVPPWSAAPPSQAIRVVQKEYIADLEVRNISIACLKQGWELGLLTAQDCVQLALRRFALGLVEDGSAEERIALLLSDNLREVESEFDAIPEHGPCENCDELWFFVRLCLLRAHVVGVEIESSGFIKDLLSESPRKWIRDVLDPYELPRPFEHGDAGYYLGVLDGILIAEYHKYCREDEPSAA
jgi:hypothetical protein